MICRVCYKETNFLFGGVCVECRELGLRGPVKNMPKNKTIIKRDNGLNEGKRDYKEYLETSRWQYARDYLNAKRNGVRLSF